MKKFTIFSILLTIVVVVVVSQILVDEYLPYLKADVSDGISISLPDTLKIGSSTGESIFGADLSLDNASTQNKEIPSDYQNITVTPQNPATTKKPNSPLNDFEDFSDPSQTEVLGNIGSVVLREDQIKSAGFIGAHLEAEDYDGLLFKSVPVDDIDDVRMEKIAIRTADQFLARVYVIRVGINSNVRDVYQLLRSKSFQIPSVQVNETNDFGVSSFYFNDSRRSNTAFLVVRIGNMIYSFSYPKDYHSQIKNLIQLLEWEVR